MLLQLLCCDGCLHNLSRVVDFSVLDDLEALKDHTLESVLALGVASERAASEETTQEVLEHVNLGEIKSFISQFVVLDHTLGRLATVLLERCLTEANVSEIRSVHDRFD